MTGKGKDGFDKRKGNRNKIGHGKGGVGCGWCPGLVRVRKEEWMPGEGRRIQVEEDGARLRSNWIQKRESGSR